jgi:hypothetical protein
MKHFFGGLMLAASLLAGGCSIRHDVARDYPQYLANNQGVSMLPSTTAASSYVISPETKIHHYEFRSAMAGYANLWMVDFGKMLGDTLGAPDVQSAFGSLTEAATANAAGNVLIFNLQSYTFAEFGAHVVLKVALDQGGAQVFQKTYSSDGKTQGGKMFFAGAFGMKNAVQQSTKLAVDDILRKLIADLNARAAASSPTAGSDASATSVDASP